MLLIGYVIFGGMKYRANGLLQHDFDDPEGITMYYEYLICIGYDTKMYQKLVGKLNAL